MMQVTFTVKINHNPRAATRSCQWRPLPKAALRLAFSLPQSGREWLIVPLGDGPGGGAALPNGITKSVFCPLLLPACATCVDLRSIPDESGSLSGLTPAEPDVVLAEMVSHRKNDFVNRSCSLAPQASLTPHLCGRHWRSRSLCPQRHG